MHSCHKYFMVTDSAAFSTKNLQEVLSWFAQTVTGTKGSTPHMGEEESSSDARTRYLSGLFLILQIG